MKEHVIGFRVDWDEYQRIEKQAEKRGEEVNEWCRNLVLSESGHDFGVTANERILLEEMGVLRKLLGEILKQMLSPEELGDLREIVEQSYPEYGRKLLEKRSAKRSDQTFEAAPEEEPEMV